MDGTSIVRVLEALGSTKIKWQGSRIQASCPFAPYKHAGGQDKNPSFGIEINPSGHSKFHCFACKSSGLKALSLLYVWKECTGSWRSDLHEIIREQEGGSLRERHSKLGSWQDQRRSINRPRTETVWNVQGYERAFALSDYTEILKMLPTYALTRGITKAQAKLWKLGFDQDAERLWIGIFDETGKLVGYSRRALYEDQEPKYLHAKDMARQKYLYGEQFIDKRCRLGLLMEGFMDVLAMSRHGWRNALATMGTEVSPQHIEKLQKWFDCVIIFPHNDAKPPTREDGTEQLPPGLQMAHDYRDALTDVGITTYIAPVFTGRKDPGDWTDEEHAAMQRRLKVKLDEFEPADEVGKGGSESQTEIGP